MAYITSIKRITVLIAVHYARPQVHAHTAHILGNAVHQVAGVVAAVKGKGQALVMAVDLVLHIVLDMARHQYKGLAHKKQEHAPQ
jgi:hypothetical protein